MKTSRRMDVKGSEGVWWRSRECYGRHSCRSGDGQPPHHTVAE
ncbi:hypothetical protein PAHAL_1G454300 [Panicum hallii]|uniref:Uncharacterized protein n=1 Tax=Panicum hallii TaxID=206008 RepID=A0A2T8KYF4_9POAL|nr:hypothetical protein PAHAL_1G454300 [Panicum hallii]